jgi:Protein of unknown function (DUF2846)
MKNHINESFCRRVSVSIVTPVLLTLMVVASIYLAGCAATPESTAPFTPMKFESSKSRIYLYRKSRFVGAVNKAEIFINNQYAGQLVNGSYCTLVTDPGTIEIKALEKLPAIFVLRHIISKLAGKQPLIDFTAEPGREYYLEFNVAGYKVKQVSKDQALALMDALKPAEILTE